LVWGFNLGSPWEVIMFQPPEKQHYEIMELSKLWNVDIKTIRHYIDDMKILRSAVIKKDQAEFKCFKVSREQRVELENILLGIDFHLSHEPGFERVDSISIFSYESCIELPKHTSDLISPPLFLYAMKYHIAGDHPAYDFKEVAFTFENFVGESFVMVDECSDIEFRCANLHPFLGIEETEIVPTEEKNRFEKSYSQLNSSGAAEPSPKTKNAYLRTIHALSKALCSGLTGKAHKDAEAVLTALDREEIKHPVGQKALAAYLDEAIKIDDNQ
jgi:hypothetical protein